MIIVNFESVRKYVSYGNCRNPAVFQIDPVLHSATHFVKITRFVGIAAVKHTYPYTIFGENFVMAYFSDWNLQNELRDQYQLMRLII